MVSLEVKTTWACKLEAFPFGDLIFLTIQTSIGRMMCQAENIDAAFTTKCCSVSIAAENETASLDFMTASIHQELNKRELRSYLASPADRGILTLSQLLINTFNPKNEDDHLNNMYQLNAREKLYCKTSLVVGDQALGYIVGGIFNAYYMSISQSQMTEFLNIVIQNYIEILNRREENNYKRTNISDTQDSQKLDGPLSNVDS